MHTTIGSSSDPDRCSASVVHYLWCSFVLFLSIGSVLPAQKNLKKNIAKWAKGNGDRAVRNFANASVRSRQVWLDARGERNEWLWAEAFIEFFNHLAFHLQGQ